MMLLPARPITFDDKMADALDGGVLSLLPALTEAVIPLVPGLSEALEDGIDVLDLGCGSGRITSLLGRAYPRSRFSGYDLSLRGVASAWTESALYGTSNVRFEVRELSGLDEVHVCDLVTAFGSVRPQARPDLVLSGARRALRPGGILLMQESDTNAGPGPVWTDGQIVEMLAAAGFRGARAHRLRYDLYSRYFVARA